MTDSNPHRASVIAKMSLLMFAQFFTWGAWFSTLGQCLGANGLSSFGGAAYGTAAIAAMIAPLFLGVVADRFFASQKIMAVLFLTAGVLMLAVPSQASAGNGQQMLWLMTAHMICYMPTISLANTICFTHLERADFPKVRVWGTIGWIAAGLFVGGLGWTSKLNIFWVSGISSLLVAGISFFLPHTPPPAKGQKVNMRAIFLIDAIGLLKQPSFAVFLFCALCICIPTGFYHGLASQYLANFGFVQAASSLTIGQMSEIIFMLLIPFFFRRLGVKWMILVGMLGWVLRYLLFAFGAPDQVLWMIFVGIALHGICYDFFYVTGFMYADRVAPKELRGQAQGLLVFMTQGVGTYLGYKIAYNSFESKVPSYGALNTAIETARGEQTLSIWQQLGQMFSFGLPKNVSPELLTQTLNQWKDLWLIPAGVAAVVSVIFFAAFWDRRQVLEDSDDA